MVATDSLILPAWMERTQRSFEGQRRRIAFAFSSGLGTIRARWPFLATLDSSLAASWFNKHYRTMEMAYSDSQFSSSFELLGLDLILPAIASQQPEELAS